MKLLKTLLIATLPFGFAGAAMADEITVEEQPSGDTLAVDSVTIAEDGWLVVHAMKDGKPVVPASLGHIAVKAGTTTDIVVPLTTPTQSGDQIMLMLHVDQGTKGTYEFPGADAPVMQDGQPVVTTIEID